MKIAHFSDWHMPDDFYAFKEVIELLENCIDTAVDKKVDHFVLSGDMVESRNLKGYKKILRAFAKRKINNSTILSIVPGNHEIHPFDEKDIVGSVRNAYSAPRNEKTFNSYIRRFVDKSEYLYSNTAVPFIKIIDKSTLLVGLDTVNATTFKPKDLPGGLISRKINIKAVLGQFTDEDESEIMESLSQLHYSKYKTKILVMHHYPLEGVEFEVDKPLLRSFTVPGDFEEGDLERIRDFIKSVGFDYVLCGHAHYLNGVEKLGKAKIINAAVYDDCYGFQLVDTATRKVKWIDAADE